MTTLLLEGSTMILRRVLCTASLAALVGAGALVPTVASAADTVVSVKDGKVRFDSATTASITLTYTCGSTESSPSNERLRVFLYQPVDQDGGYEADADGPDDGLPAVCDGTARTTDAIPLEVVEGTFHNESAQVKVVILDEDAATWADVRVVGVPKRLLALTAKARGSVEAGHTITIKGTATRDRKPVKKRKVSLLFAADGDGTAHPPGDDSYVKIKTVRSDQKGKLAVTLEPTESGIYAFYSKGTYSVGVPIQVQ